MKQHQHDGSVRDHCGRLFGNHDTANVKACERSIAETGAISRSLQSVFTQLPDRGAIPRVKQWNSNMCHLTYLALHKITWLKSATRDALRTLLREAFHLAFAIFELLVYILRHSILEAANQGRIQQPSQLDIDITRRCIVLGRRRLPELRYPPPSVFR
jgi:hypothetical protein